MSTLAPNSYLRDAILTATAEQLQLMLYDGAIRFARQGRDALEARDFEKSYEKLSRAQAIIIEMENGLRPEVNPELCSRMASIYGFLYRKLVDASVNRDPSAIDDALKVLYIERDTWVMLIEKVNQARAAGASAPQGQPSTEQGSLSVEG
jgi:flagellar protein FliS